MTGGNTLAAIDSLDDMVRGAIAGIGRGILHDLARLVALPLCRMLQRAGVEDNAS